MQEYKPQSTQRKELKKWETTEYTEKYYNYYHILPSEWHQEVCALCGLI